MSICVLSLAVLPGAARIVSAPLRQRKEVAAVPALADNACEVRTLLHAVSRDSGILWRWPGPDVGIVRQLRAGPLRATMTL